MLADRRSLVEVALRYGYYPNAGVPQLLINRHRDRLVLDSRRIHELPGLIDAGRPVNSGKARRTPEGSRSRTDAPNTVSLSPRSTMPWRTGLLA